MRYLFALCLLASCRQAPSPAVAEAVWPPPADALAEPLQNPQQLPAAVSMADLASAATQ